MLTEIHLSIYDYEHMDISEIRWLYNWMKQKVKSNG